MPAPSFVSTLTLEKSEQVTMSIKRTTIAPNERSGKVTDPLTRYLTTAPASVYAQCAALVGLTTEAPWQAVRDKLNEEGKESHALTLCYRHCPMTADDALTLTYGDVIYHATLRNSDGSAVRARVNGKVKTWKRRPGYFQIPMKHGLRDCFYLTPDGSQRLENWRLSDPTETD